MSDSRTRVALVTGGSRGIGAAVARRLAECGTDLALTYERAEEQATSVVGEITRMGRRSAAIRADSGDPAAITDAVERVVREFGRLDIVVHNAGAYMVGPIEELGPEEFDRIIAVNVRAPYLASRVAARYLGEGGRIISVGSNVAGRTVFPGLSLYAMSKTALVGMTKGLARDLGPRGITVNLVSPGPADTDANPADGPNAETIGGLTALGRYSTPREVADVVAFLAGDGGRYVTGAEIKVDGGFTV